MLLKIIPKGSIYYIQYNYLHTTFYNKSQLTRKMINGSILRFIFAQTFYGYVFVLQVCFTWTMFAWLNAYEYMNPNDLHRHGKSFFHFDERYYKSLSKGLGLYLLSSCNSNILLHKVKTQYLQINNIVDISI